VNAARTTDDVTPLLVASEKGYLELARLLLDRGAFVDDAGTNNGLAPLIFASQTGNFEIARLLLDRGANVTTPESNGITPLMRACQSGHLAVVQLLLSRGANKDVVAGGHSAASLAATPEVKHALK
jgi:ankyrin repeat protein